MGDGFSENKTVTLKGNEPTANFESRSALVSNSGCNQMDKRKVGAAAIHSTEVVGGGQSASDGGPSSKDSYVASFDFVGENEGEITLNEGDDVEMLEFGEDWSYVRVWDEEGWAPTAFLQSTDSQA